MTFSLNKRLLKSIFIGALCSAAAITALMLLCALLFSAAGIYPDGALDYITLGFVAAGSLLGGFIASRLNRRSGLLTGVITGLCVFVIVLLTGLWNGVSVFAVYKLLAAVVGGALGGILGIKK